MTRKTLSNSFIETSKMSNQLPTRIGKVTRRKKIDGTPLVYTVVEEDVFVAPSNPNKAFAFQKLQFDDGHVQFRLCYYMIAHKPRMKGKWAFGQFSAFMTPDELALVVQRALANGWLSYDILAEQGGQPKRR